MTLKLDLIDILSNMEKQLESLISEEEDTQLCIDLSKLKDKVAEVRQERENTNKQIKILSAELENQIEIRYLEELKDWQELNPGKEMSQNSKDLLREAIKRTILQQS